MEIEEDEFGGEDELVAAGQKNSSRGKKESGQTEGKLDDEMRELIDRAADGYAQRMRSGEKIGLSSILEDVMSAIMKKEREYFLQEVPDTPNGFYSRTLQLAIGKLNLKVPRVRISNAFRPALLPAKWKSGQELRESPGRSSYKRLLAVADRKSSTLS